MLADECLGVGSRAATQMGPGSLPPERKSEYYGDAEFLDQQLRLIDLIPRPLWVLALVWLAGLAAVTGLEMLHARTADMLSGGDLKSPLQLPDHGRPAAFDLGSAGSLGTWFSSVLLLAAAIGAVAVYAIRRHRTDDYNGHYRVWLWTAMWWVLMSADQVAGINEGFAQVMIHLTGTRLVGDGWLWSWIPCVLLLGMVGSRLAVDMWPCRLSTAVLALAALCGGLAVATQAGWFIVADGPGQVMFAAGARLIGGLFLLLAMGLHARYVLLDAEGRLPRREPKPAKEPADDSEDEEDGEKTAPAGTAASGAWTRVDSPQGVPQPALARTAPAVASSVAASTSATSAVKSPSSSYTPAASTGVSAGLSAAASSVNRKLTKGEKKALRQRLEQERLNRESQQRSAWK
jgi:hypothetical protein